MKLTDKASVKGVIESMSLEEKLRALVRASFFRHLECLSTYPNRLHGRGQA